MPSARTLNRAFAVKPDPLAGVLAGLEPGQPDLSGLGAFPAGALPGPLRGGLGRGQPGRQVRVSEERMPGGVRLLPRRQRVVEHDPGAAERFAEGEPVPGPRVETVIVPELHPAIIFAFVAFYRM